MFFSKLMVNYISKYMHIIAHLFHNVFTEMVLNTFEIKDLFVLIRTGQTSFDRTGFFEINGIESSGFLTYILNDCKSVVLI